MEKRELDNLKEKLDAGDSVVELQFDDEDFPSKVTLITKDGYGFSFHVVNDGS
jgi:hypothetical protein